MSFALLPTTLTMLCAGMAGIFLVLGVLVLGVYLLNKVFQKKDKHRFKRYLRPRSAKSPK